MDNKIKTKILFEVSQIDTLFEKADLLIQKCKITEPDFIDISAAGYTLHSYYNGLENIFLLISKNIDKTSFSSQRWHKELLDSMFLKNNMRNPILDEKFHETLLDYMSFRHVFRHSYGYVLDWNRLKPLFFSMSENWKEVKSSILSFVEQIEPAQ